MFGIASRYVKARRKAPAFHIICKYNYFPIKKDTTTCASFYMKMQGKGLATDTAKSGDFAELNATKINIMRMSKDFLASAYSVPQKNNSVLKEFMTVLLPSQVLNWPLNFFVGS
jgi:hypothetical protein